MSLPGIIILAAGASARLGQPKQLLHYKGESLIQRITQIAIQVVKEPVVVVLGANMGLILGHLNHLPVLIRQNPGWEEGIASSVREGLLAILKYSPEPDAVIFLVCDQPHITHGLLREMITAREKTGKSIIACGYDNTLGTPVLFSKVYFDELLQLKNNEGAKKVLYNHAEAVGTVPFPGGNVDIDTIWDYSALQLYNC